MSNAGSDMNLEPIMKTRSLIKTKRGQYYIDLSRKTMKEYGWEKGDLIQIYRKDYNALIIVNISRIYNKSDQLKIE